MDGINLVRETNVESLQDYCLREILENFDRYIAGYKAPHGRVLAKQFEFLRRAYSETLFYKLKENDKLEKKHMDLLVNPYLKHLDVEHLDEELIFLIGNKLKINGNGVISMKAKNSKMLSQHLIPSSSHLEVIEIGGFRGNLASSIQCIIYTTELIKALGSHCPALRILKRSGDEDTSSCQFFFSFRHRILPKLYEAVCSLLDNCPSLEIMENVNAVEVLYQRHKLDLQNNDLEKQRKYSLTNLAFYDGGNYPLEDAFKICLVLCPKVSRVHLWIKSDDQLLRYTDFSLLDDVIIMTSKITADGLSQFLLTKGNKLVNLELYDVCVSAQAIVECCPVLKSLILSNIYHCQPLSDKDFSVPVTRLPNLKSLTVEETSFSQKKVADSFKLILSAAKNLETLTFRCTVGLSQDFCTTMFEFGLNHVHELNVIRTDITLPPLANLLLLGNLQKLNVRYCKNIYHDDYHTLRKCKGNDKDLEVMCSSVSDWCSGNWLLNSYVDLSRVDSEFSDQMLVSDSDSDLEYEYDDT